MTRLYSPLLALLNVNFAVYIAALTVNPYAAPATNSLYDPYAFPTQQSYAAPANTGWYPQPATSYYDPFRGQYVNPDTALYASPGSFSTQDVNNFGQSLGNVDDQYDPSRWRLQASQPATSPPYNPYNPYNPYSQQEYNDDQYQPVTTQQYPPPLPGAYPFGQTAQAPTQQTWPGGSPYYDGFGAAQPSFGSTTGHGGNGAQSQSNGQGIPPPGAVYVDENGVYYDENQNPIPPAQQYPDQLGNTDAGAWQYDPNAAYPQDVPQPIQPSYTDGNGKYYDENQMEIPYDQLYQDEYGNIFYIPSTPPASQTPPAEPEGQQQWVDANGKPLDLTKYYQNEYGQVVDEYMNLIDTSGWKLAAPTPPAKPAPKPAPKPATKPAAKPAPKPATKPTAKPAAKPAVTKPGSTTTKKATTKKTSTKPSVKKKANDYDDDEYEYDNGAVTYAESTDNSLDSWYSASPKVTGKKSNNAVDDWLNSNSDGGSSSKKTKSSSNSNTGKKRTSSSRSNRRPRINSWY